jgi:mono/diheme cytochrome c family protein
MPSFGWNLSDQEIADVLTYVRNAWGNAAQPVQPADVTKLRGRLQRNAAGGG